MAFFDALPVLIGVGVGPPVRWMSVPLGIMHSEVAMCIDSVAAST